MLICEQRDIFVHDEDPVDQNNLVTMLMVNNVFRRFLKGKSLSCHTTLPTLHLLVKINEEASVHCGIHFRHGDGSGDIRGGLFGSKMGSTDQQVQNILITVHFADDDSFVCLHSPLAVRFKVLTC